MAAVLGLLLGLPASSQADPLNYIFTQIADDSSGSPFSAFGFNSAINNDGTVAFNADLRTGGRGIFTGRGGPLTLIATDTSGSISSLISAPTINDAGTVAFTASLRAGGRGVFTGNGGSLTTIATASGVLDIQSLPVINNGGMVVFNVNLTGGGQAIVTGRGGPLTTLYDTGPGSPFSALVTFPALNNRGMVAFRPNLTAGGAGLFTGDGGPPTTIADTSGPFSGLSAPSINDAGTVAFRAILRAGGQAIFAGSGGPLTRIADTSGPFSSFGSGGNAAINNEGMVVFSANLRAGGNGLFTGPDATADRILGTGDPLFGSTVTATGDFFGPSLNDRGQFVFRVTLTDGRQVLVRADPVPEPSTWVLFGLGALGLIGYGRWRFHLLRPYAFVRQADGSDCGAAALATIALHYRIPVPLQQLRDLTGTDRSGTSLLGLLRAAEKLGLSGKGVKGPYEALTQMPLPAIAHLKTVNGLGHFVVLYMVKKDAVVVADPAAGIDTLSRDEFCRRWTGNLLVLVPDPNATTTCVRNIPTNPWRRFWGLLRCHTPVLAEAFFCALLMTVLGVSTSYFIQHLVDSVLVRNDGRLLNALGVGMVLVVLFRTLFGMLRQYLLAYVGRKVDLALIADYTRHILGLPLQFFEMRRVGEILSRVNDAGKVREAISGTTTTAVVDGTLVVLLLAVLWLYDLPLALVATAFIPLLVASVLIHHPASRRRSREAMEHAAQFSAHQVENVAGVETVKAFGVETLRAEEGETRLVRLVQSLFALQKLGISTGAVGTCVTALAGIVILWYGGYRTMAGALTIGQLMFFYSLLGSLLEPLERLAAVNLKIQDALVAVDRLYQVMDLELEPLREDHKVPFTEVRQGIELREVSFRYGSRANVLEQLNLRIPAGKTVAVIGESGSGKSTLLKLLMGFYAPTEGNILIDGVDMRDVALDSLRSRHGLVAQDPFIFTGTLRDNIALGRPEATLAEVMEAARAAGLEEFIAGLPERYETIIGERGANLSGGQRQRLAIARALLRRPQILIFDEATSHLDTATERAIQENLKTALAGKTVVLVAHRLSTIKDADLIYVLQKGRIVEEGTHRQLLARQGWYAALWRSQTAGGEDCPRPLSAAVASRNGTDSNGKAFRECVSHA
jgi:ATP-binding cassette subfamily B protein